MKQLFQTLLITVITSLFSSSLYSQKVINPEKVTSAVIPGDFADPTVISSGEEYFAVGTSSEWAPHFPIYKSSDLINWKQISYIFEKAPEWTSGSFWAPEYYFHNGTYFLYYTARRKKDNTSCIGVATSKYPDKGFVDHGVIIDYGKEAIDAFVFSDDGQRYITFKAYGLDKRPIEILGLRLSQDGLSTVGEAFSLLKDDKGVGIEGQSIIKHEDEYYLFYSAGNCCGAQCNYNVNVAKAKTLKGPYEPFTNNPILSENAFWKCAGHGTFVKQPNGKTNYLYHAYNKASTVFGGRQGMLAELTWNSQSGWPTLTEVSGSDSKPNIKMTFDTKDIDKRWQWDFRNSTSLITQAAGKINLSGTAKKGNLSGIVLTLRPASAAFEAKTQVLNLNGALKGLAYYGDANAALGIGVKDNQVQYWMVKDSVRTILATSKILTAKPVELMFKTANDSKVMVYFKQGSESWKELKSSKAVTTLFLPQWDRSPRIGIHMKGASGLKASFSYFILEY
jgi:beta-xylosidase